MGRIDIRFGGYQPPASVHNRAAEALGRALARRAGEAVRFHLDGDIMASGHKAADLLTLVEGGELTMCYFSTSYLAARIPEFALLDLPFVFDRRDRAHAVLDGPLGRLLADKVRANTGYRLLGLWDNGFRHLTNRVRPIRTPADCRGMRIRTLFSDLHSRVFAALGFEPVALDVKDLVAAVEAGDVDAHDNPLTNIFNFGIHRYHRHITLSGHFFGAAALLCHKASHASWPAEVRQAVAQAAAEATAAQRRFAAAQDTEVLAKLDPAENQVVRLSAAERGRFVAAVAPVIEEQRQAFGDELFRYLE